MIDAQSFSPITSIRQARQTVHTLTGGLSDSQLLWSPDKEVWSLAQQIDHQFVVGNLLLPRLEGAVATLREQGKRSAKPFRPNFIESYFVRTLGPGGNFKMPVPPLFEPKMNSDAPSEIIQRYISLQDSLLQCIESANGLDLGAVNVTSPASSLLRLRLGAWFLALPAHQEYHLESARKLRESPDFPK